MNLKRIFWAMLAGVSFSLSGCEDENPPADATDAPDVQDVQSDDGVSDVADIPDLRLDEGMADAYGPPDFPNRDVMDVTPDEPEAD